MKLSKTKISKIEKFLAKVQNDIYPEPPSQLHREITEKMVNYVMHEGYLRPGDTILDIGCGQGVALELFSKNGFSAVGITLGKDDLKACREEGFNVYEMDQSFLDFPDRQFDFIWCRHCLEHSIFPYFTLTELFRVLKTHGRLYVEVPAPDTSCNHQTNQNHYSVLGKSMWSELIKRVGFKLLKVLEINFETPMGRDTYYTFIQQKP
jgi:ubiquinone/menaquinone biosynthesis C-methylase UbiE